MIGPMSQAKGTPDNASLALGSSFARQRRLSWGFCFLLTSRALDYIFLSPL